MFDSIPSPTSSSSPSHPWAVPAEDGGFAHILEDWRSATGAGSGAALSGEEELVRHFGDAYDPIRKCFYEDRFAPRVALQLRAFSAFFRDRMREAGIPAGGGFSIAMDPAGRISIHGRGSLRVRIEALFQRDPELDYAYRAICAACSEVAFSQVGSRYAAACRTATSDEARAAASRRFRPLFQQSEALCARMDYAGGEFSSPAAVWAQGLPAEGDEPMPV